jgi:hypothetical protein
MPSMTPGSTACRVRELRHGEQGEPPRPPWSGRDDRLCFAVVWLLAAVLLMLIAGSVAAGQPPPA